MDLIQWYLIALYKRATLSLMPMWRVALVFGLAAAAMLAPAHARASDGVLDNTFGTGGKVMTDIRSSDDAVRGMVFQADGKILVVGSSYVHVSSPHYVFTVARYNLNGTLDSSFAGGVVTTAFGSDDATANAVAIQSDGKIIAAGYVTPSSGYGPATAMALTRYNSDGSLDTGFGTNGLVSTPVPTPSGGNAQIEAIVIQPDGKILVGGHVMWDSNYSKTVFLLARFDPNGTLDSSFGKNGILTHAVGGSCANSSSAVYAMALQPDGKIVASGYAIVDCPAQLRFAVTRYNSDGSPDPTFNGNGIVTMFNTAGGRKGWVGGAAALIQPDGKIVLTGPTGTQGSNGTQQFALLRLKPDGAADTSFGSMGIVTTMLGSRSEPYALKLQVDGKLVVAGDAYVGTEAAFAMARYNGDGSLDATFGSSGSVISDFNAQDDGVNAMAIQADGKLVVAGFAHIAAGGYGDFALARYSGTNPHPLAVNSIRSRFGGNTGPVTVTVFGAGFQPNAEVRLACAGQSDIIGTKVRVNGGGVSLSVLFDLTGAALGTCDVVVKNPDNATATLPDGFAIVLGTPGHPSVAVLGRTRVRAGSREGMYIHLGNSGNIDAVVPFWVAFHLDPLTHLQQGTLNFAPYNGPLDPDANDIDFNQVPAAFDRVDPETGDSQRVYPMSIYVPAGGDVLLPVTIASLCTGQQAMRVGVGSPMDILHDRPTMGCMLSIANLLLNLAPGNACIKGPLKLLLYDRLQERWGTPVSVSAFAVSDMMMIAKCAASLFPPLQVPLAVADTLRTGLSTLNNCGKMMGSWEQTASGDVTQTCVYSHDPNDKVGNKGFGTQGYLAANERLGYAIFFENQPEATAPAQDVVITDQLDPAKLDFSTFSLGPIGVGNKLLTPPSGLTEFTGDLDLRPENNMIAHVTAKLDLTSGLLKWTLGSLDPATGLPTTDPLAGLLPPNVNSPVGEGSVLFTVLPKDDLPTDTAITNQASIVFDNNAPLATPTWLNTIDRIQPVSQVLALAPTQPTAKFTVQWSGTDVGSGIKHFNVFVSDNEEPFVQWLERTSATSDTFSGQNGHTYKFFSVTEDNAGNVEPGKTEAEAVTIVNIPDAMPPVTLGEESPDANASGWHKQDFTVTLTATDNDGGSGVQQITYSASGATVIGSTNVAGNFVTIPVTAEGLTTITFYATDKAGNTEASNSLTVRLDRTAPEITASRSPLANPSGWNNTGVVVSFACADTLSGLGAGSPPANTTLGDGAGQSVSGTCTDLAGNSAVVTVGGINVDQTPPVVKVTGFTDGASYTPATLPTAGCTTTDALSGVATFATVSVAGGTNGVGKFTATCGGASDVAGNVAPAETASYYVRYNFIGFLPPLVAGQASYSGSYKLGRTIPVKWQLTNAQGGYVSSLSAVTSLKTAFLGECSNDSGAAADLGTSGNTDLRYDATTNQFIYNWNTSGLASGCYELQLSLDDKGSAHTTVVNLKQ